MGLKEYMAEKAAKAAVYATTEVADRGIKAISAAYNSEERVEARKARAALREIRSLEKAESRDANYMSKRPANTFRYISMENSGSNALFKVSNTFGDVLYTASGTASMSNVNLKVKSATKHIVSEIKKARFIVRNPLYREENAADYDIVVDRHNRATVKSANFDKKSYFYEVEPFGWTVDYGGGGYAVEDDGVTLFFFDQRLGYKNLTYLIDFRDPQIEQMAVLITIAIMCHSGLKE